MAEPQETTAEPVKPATTAAESGKPKTPAEWAAYEARANKLLAIDRINLFIGQPSAGKSNAIHYIVKSTRYMFDYGVVVCPSASDGAYDWFDPRMLKIVYNESILAQIKSVQDQNGAKRMLLILDDCLGWVNWQSDLVIQIMMTTRHLKMTICLAGQYINKIIAPIREASTRAFIWRQETRNAMRSIYESFLQSKFDRELDAKLYFNQQTSKPYTALYYRRDAKSEAARTTVAIFPNMDGDTTKITWPVKKDKK